MTGAVHSFTRTLRVVAFRKCKSMSRDARQGIRADPRRIVGFISDSNGGMNACRAARADWASYTCNASLRRAREPAAACLPSPLRHAAPRTGRAAPVRDCLTRFSRFTRSTARLTR
ncbi:unnamed protein product [Leptosia nina]|uniref:Uncharacterized protein n=1 Tax=Leptosia nina TaxID=320188 RepID=A0AAV1K368_9NEOP